MELWMYVVAVVGGLVAGFINVLAGYGSVITLAILMDVIGLPGVAANGTNRVGVLAMSVAGTSAYQKNGMLDFARGKFIIIAVFIGAVAGVLTAISVSNEQFREIFKYLVVLFFFLLLVNPKKWIKEHVEDYDLPWWKALLIYIPIGFYGGFIQVGMGIIFLAATVLMAKFSLMKANALKLVVVMTFTIMALAIFQYKGLVNWKVGALLAAGQATGGYLTAHYASNWKNANVVAYRVLMVVITVVMLKTFGVFNYFF